MVRALEEVDATGGYKGGNSTHTTYTYVSHAHTAYALLHMLFVVYDFHTHLACTAPFSCFAVYLLLAHHRHTYYTSHVSMHTVIRSTHHDTL